MNEKTLDIRTICRDCVFAVYDDKLTHQVDCKFGRIKKFKEQDKLIQLEDKETNLKYFAINTLCNRCRNIEWGLHQEDIENRVIEETTIRIAYILIANHDNDRLMETLNSILIQNPQPIKIAVVFSYGNTQIKEFVSKIKGLPAKIDVVNVLQDFSMHNLIDSGAKRLLNSQYITVIGEGNIMPANFAKRLDSLINEELKQISLVDAEEPKLGLTFHTHLFTLLGGNRDEYLADKIKGLARQQNLQHMIIPLEEVINE
jgi:hypothetical protein